MSTRRSSETTDRHSPSPFLGRTQTNTQEEISNPKPVVDKHDRMWAEIDVLDDASQLASQVKKTGSFFGPAHAEASKNLRQAQIDLAHETAQVEAHQDRSEYKLLWENGDIASLRKVLFDDRHYEALSAHVDHTVQRLEQVSALMTAVDEQSKELWHSLNANEVIEPK